MGPILYMLPAAPPVRAVLMCAKAINLYLEHKLVNLLDQAQHKDEFKKLNPNHTVPTLVDEDIVLQDSHSILGYLVGKYGKSDELYPKFDVRKRAIIDDQLYFDSSTLFPRGVLISSSIIYHGAKIIQQAYKESLLEAYTILEKNLADKKYVAGQNLSIADFSIITSITSWNIIIPINKEQFPNIHNWMEIMYNLPFYQETNENGLEDYKNLILRNLSVAD